MAVIDYHEGFDIKEYTDTFADKTKDWLIVWEIGKGKKHWHAVFTVKKFPQGHAPSFPSHDLPRLPTIPAGPPTPVWAYSTVWMYRYA